MVGRWCRRACLRIATGRLGSPSTAAKEAALGATLVAPEVLRGTAARARLEGRAAAPRRRVKDNAAHIRPPLRGIASKVWLRSIEWTNGVYVMR